MASCGGRGGMGGALNARNGQRFPGLRSRREVGDRSPPQRRRLGPVQRHLWIAAPADGEALVVQVWQRPDRVAGLVDVLAVPHVIVGWLDVAGGGSIPHERRGAVWSLAVGD